MSDEPVFDWYCPDCDTTRRSPGPATDDWNDGVPYVIGPDCPECDCPMELDGEVTT